jgi:hypothetical protein
VFARAFVLDDAMYELMQTVPQWLAGWSLTGLPIQRRITSSGS